MLLGLDTSIDPLTGFRKSGYLERISAERGARNLSTVSSYA